MVPSCLFYREFTRTTSPHPHVPVSLPPQVLRPMSPSHRCVVVVDIISVIVISIIHDQRSLYNSLYAFVNPGLPVLLEDQPHPLDENIRRVERGSRIVVAVTQDTKVVLQVFHPTNEHCLDMSFQSRRQCLAEQFPQGKCRTCLVPCYSSVFFL